MKSVNTPFESYSTEIINLATSLVGPNLKVPRAGDYLVAAFTGSGPEGTLVTFFILESLDGTKNWVAAAGPLSLGPNKTLNSIVRTTKPYIRLIGAASDAPVSLADLQEALKDEPPRPFASFVGTPLTEADIKAMKVEDKPAKLKLKGKSVDITFHAVIAA